MSDFCSKTHGPRRVSAADLQLGDFYICWVTLPTATSPAFISTSLYLVQNVHLCTCVGWSASPTQVGAGKPVCWSETDRAAAGEEAVSLHQLCLPPNLSPAFCREHQPSTALKVRGKAMKWLSSLNKTWSFVYGDSTTHVSPSPCPCVVWPPMALGHQGKLPLPEAMELGLAQGQEWAGDKGSHRTPGPLF